ncbi:hypothetical protein DR999_PMT08932 [Platysternon megacephalum]|uniref:Uncharacterized protein n=1 Tax=Platysternon megacephalum TaxID=55544 RepID=A0A4D9EQ45_9SAUR|nr:hypothetical protein DR999_PMT08932 [Platysternon megacephalum]
MCVGGVGRALVSSGTDAEPASQPTSDVNATSKEGTWEANPACPKPLPRDGDNSDLLGLFPCMCAPLNASPSPRISPPRSPSSPLTLTQNSRLHFHLSEPNQGDGAGRCWKRWAPCCSIDWLGGLGFLLAACRKEMAPCVP